MERGLVLFGDVVDSRRNPARASAWLRRLSSEFDARFASAALAPFGFTQGDELQGLLRPDADPLPAVVSAATDPEPVAMRWVAVVGPIDPGSGPATQRTGRAFLEARELLGVAERRRDGLLVRTGDPWPDDLLDDVAPPLAVLLRGLTPFQRRVARLLLVERISQAEAAARLAISRPTVSVAADRAHVREIDRLWRAIQKLLAAGVSAAATRAEAS